MSGKQEAPPLKKQATEIRFSRKWSMPNANTFSMKPIKDRLETLVPDKSEGKIWIDPFARNSIFKDRCTYTNDLNKEFDCTHHMDALDFLKTFEDKSVDGVLYDPPYSVRQVQEVYSGVGRKVTADDTKATVFTNFKKEISRVTKDNGHVICFGWNSGGIGKGLGFDIEEILLVPHGGPHNDTIMTICVKTLPASHETSKTAQKDPSANQASSQSPPEDPSTA